MFNAKDIKKTNQKSVWVFMLLIGMLALGTISCDEDDNDNNNTVTPVPEPDPIPEVPTGWLIGYVNSTPQGGVYYMEASENIPEETNVSNAVEIGLGARVLSFGEHPYTWNNAAGTLTKWSVDRTTLEFSVEGVISFASLGVSGNVGAETRFVSETKAYVQNLAEGIIVEFNPSVMEITEEINFGVPFPNAVTGRFIINDPVVIPESEIIVYGMSYFPGACCEYDGPDAYTIVVLDTRSNTVELRTDQRLLIGEEALMPSDDGFIYISPGLGQSVAVKYLDNVPAGPSSEFNVLRMDLDGNFDPDYSLDISSVLSKEFARAFEIPPSGNVRPFIVPNNSFAENWNDRFGIFSDFPEWNVVGVNYVTGEVEPLTAFDGFNFVTLPTTIDGQLYVTVGLVELDDNDAETEVSYLARVEDGFNFTLLTRAEGGVLRRLAQLW